MAFTDYVALQAAVANWLNRADLAAVVPDFIALAEPTLSRRLRDRRMQVTAQATLNNARLPLPADCVGVRALAYAGAGGTVTLKPATLDEVLARDTGANGYPAFYAVDGATLHITPVPAAAIDAELTYYARIPALSSANPSNWLLVHAPDVYLYGALVESAPFLKDDERVAMWQAILDKRIEEMRTAGAKEEIGQGPLMARVRRSIG